MAGQYQRRPVVSHRTPITAQVIGGHRNSCASRVPAVVAVLVCAGCTSAAPGAPDDAWQAVTPPGIAPSSLTVGGDVVLVGGSSGAGRPAVAGLEQARFIAAPRVALRGASAVIAGTGREEILTATAADRWSSSAAPGGEVRKVALADNGIYLLLRAADGTGTVVMRGR